MAKASDSDVSFEASNLDRALFRGAPRLMKLGESYSQGADNLEGGAKQRLPQKAENRLENGDANTLLTKNPQGAVLSGMDFEFMTEAINAACAMLKELSHRNDDLVSSAEASIMALKTQLAVEKDRSNKLQRELDALRAEKERLANESQNRVKQLEAINATLAENLDRAMRELEASRPWLEYLNSKICHELRGASAEAERALSGRPAFAN